MTMQVLAGLRHGVAALEAARALRPWRPDDRGLLSTVERTVQVVPHATCIQADYTLHSSVQPCCQCGAGAWHHAEALRCFLSSGQIPDISHASHVMQGYLNNDPRTSVQLDRALATAGALRCHSLAVPRLHPILPC